MPDVDESLRIAGVLEASLEAPGGPEHGAVEFGGMELLAASKRLLRVAVGAFKAAPRSVDLLEWNDVLRHAGKHGVMDPAEVERWLGYRAWPGAQLPGSAGLDGETLGLLPEYVADVRHLAVALRRFFDAAS